MNERIRELAEQANARKLDWAYYRGEKKPGTAVDLHSVDLELFAELIINKCIEIDIENPDARPGVEIARYFGIK